MNPEPLTEASLPLLSCRSIEPGRRLRIGVLHNPLSGRNRSDPEGMFKVLREFPDVLSCEVRDPAEVADALEAFSQQDCELIVINGGDGTIQATLTTLFQRQLFQALPFLAVLPAGTTNMVAGDVGLRGNRRRALGQLCRWIPSGSQAPTLLKRHVLRVQSDFHADPLCGMFFGTGGILQGIDYCRGSVESRGIRGEIGPALAIARFLFALVCGRSDVLQPVPLSFAVDGQPLERSDCLALLVSTLDHLFLGLRPYWGREPAPLSYSHIRAHPQYLRRVLFSLLRGRPHPMATKAHGYDSANVWQVQLEVSRGFTLDGELFAGTDGVGKVVVSHAGQVFFVQ